MAESAPYEKKNQVIFLDFFQGHDNFKKLFVNRQNWISTFGKTVKLII